MASSEENPRVAILGGTGFAGALAASLIDRHPNFELGSVTARAEAGTALRDLYPHYRVDRMFQEPDLDKIAAEHDVAIVGYPHGTASEAVAALHSKGLVVVDLSADFRLTDPELYKQWYGDVHVAPELFGTAVYGLPELNRDKLATVCQQGRLIAGPGCFPTAAILTLAPLAQAGLIDDVVIDAKTGVSGSGRSLIYESHYVAVSENVHAYKTGAHRHQPEMRQELVARGMDQKVQPTFVPHLVPVDQGELVSCYVKPTRPVTAEEICEIFQTSYTDEAFVELTDADPGMRDVANTNICRIKTTVDKQSGQILAFGAIDNLWKGTSSQAVQSLNIAFGFSEGAGLR